MKYHEFLAKIALMISHPYRILFTQMADFYSGAKDNSRRALSFHYNLYNCVLLSAASA